MYTYIPDMHTGAYMTHIQLYTHAYRCIHNTYTRAYMTHAHTQVYTYTHAHSQFTSHSVPEVFKVTKILAE